MIVVVMDFCVLFFCFVKEKSFVEGVLSMM